MATVLEREVEAFGATVSDYDRQRLQVYDGLVTELEKSREGVTDDQFARVFSHAQTVFGLNDLELARLLKVSRPTVGRWAGGHTAPHTVMADAVFNVLIGVAKNELRRLRKIAR